MEIPEDIKDARSFLEQAEKESDPEKKLDELNDALDLLDSYVDGNPDITEKIKIYIRNMRRAHTRRLLNQLVSVRGIDIRTWFDYIVLLTTKLKIEMDFVIEEDPELKKNFDEFWGVYSQTVEKMMKK